MLTDPKEEKLFAKIREGDIIAFEAIFKKYYRTLCIFAEHFVFEQEMAKEIVGDFFLKFWEKRRSIKINESGKAYLFKSVQNQCLKYLEHLKVLNKYHDYAVNMLKYRHLLVPSSKEYPLANLISQESIAEIEMAIEELPEKCREIFKLSRFEEMSYEEIASKLNISINTVRTQMTRALLKLKERLKNLLPLAVLGILGVFK